MRTPLVPILRVGYFRIFQVVTLIYPLLVYASLSNVLLSTKVLFNFEPCPGLPSPCQLRSKAEAIRNRPPYVSKNSARRQAQQRPQFVTSLYFKD